MKCPRCKGFLYRVPNNQIIVEDAKWKCLNCGHRIRENGFETLPLRYVNAFENIRDKSREDRAVELHEQGIATSVIARRLGYHDSYQVWRVLRRKGVKRVS
jgi:predicted Zn finger-like uncharacterized protein